MKNSQRKGAAVFVVLSLILASLSWVSSASAQAIASPVAPGQPVTAPDDSGVTVNNEEGDLSTSALVGYFTVEYKTCGTTDILLQDTTTYFFDGEVSAADTANDCTWVTGSNGLLRLTGVSGQFNVTIEDGYSSDMQDTIPAGTYTLSFIAGGIPEMLPGTITMEPDDEYQLKLVHYVAAVDHGNSTDLGFGNITGYLASCHDPARVEDVDFFFSKIQVAEVGDCSFYGFGQSGMQLSGTPNDDTLQPFVPIETQADSSFSFSDIPFGTYQLTDMITGKSSDFFILDGTVDGKVEVFVYNYYADEPVTLPDLAVTKYFCADSDRADTTEFVFLDDNADSSTDSDTAPSGLGSTCIIDPGGDDTDVALTLKTDPAGEIVQTETIDGYFDWAQFAPIQPGSYTLTEDVDGTITQSEPFTLDYGDEIEIYIVNYVNDLDAGEPQGSDPLEFRANLWYCTSVVRAGEVDFLINNQIVAQDAGESQCREANDGEGYVVLYHYASADATESDATIYPDWAPDGNFGFGHNEGIAPGWYRIGFQDSAFSSSEVLSDIFPLSATFYDDNTGQHYFENEAIILAYTGVAPAATVRVEKQICVDPEKVDTTDFLVNQLPDGDFSAQSTIICRFLTGASERFPSVDPEITFTLTNTETDVTVPGVVNDQDSPWHFDFPAVPAGTYVLTENNGASTATSEPFIVDPSTGEPLIVVRNYTATAFTDEREGDADDFSLLAFTCQNDTFETHFDYTFFPFGFSDRLPSGEPFEEGGFSSAAAGITEFCEGAASGEYQFQLESVVTGSDVTAQAPITLTQDSDYPSLFHFEGYDDFGIPAGAYVIHEILTGATSDQIDVVASDNLEGGGNEDNYAEFYFYPAAPTPSPTATATVTPTVSATATATATATSPNDPTATATLPGTTPGSTPPGATATATSTSTIPSGGDGDVGIPPKRTPTATSGDPGSDGTSGGGVTTLPSTGQGQSGSTSTGMIWLLGLALSLLLASAALSRRKRA